MKLFLSCDWGTTAFRLRLVDFSSLQVLAEESLRQGIAETWRLWTQTGSKQEERLAFYLAIISKHITAIQTRTGRSLKSIPLVISGMASSTVGMIELPYKQCPFLTDGSDLTVQIINSEHLPEHKMIMISGAATQNDVMRGEETIVVGCTSVTAGNNDAVFVFPGTHSKHVFVCRGKVDSFKTYMTGEFFELLTQKSILANSVEEGASFDLETCQHAFEKGVKQGQNSNILNTCFSVRINDIFKRLGRQENYYYLSGLLIGSELNSLGTANIDITIVGNTTLTTYYVKALELLNLVNIRTQNADEALIKGQSKILQKLLI